MIKQLLMKTNLFFFLSCLPIFCFSQGFTVDLSVSADTMVYDFFQNDSVTISNVTTTSNGINIGFFDKGDTDFPVSAGMVLSTGNVTEIPGLGGDFISANLNILGDDDVTFVTGIGTNDATIIEFDFVPTTDQVLDFKYSFGSEEYPEFVNTTFNDAFLFLVSGPGLEGNYSNDAENTAMIPDSDLPVSINTVNDGSFPEYYIDNTNGSDIALDAYTSQLPAQFMVQAGEMYHAKIVIADTGDSAFDSGIFLGYNSLGNNDSLVPPTEFELLVQNGELIIENKSKYATDYFWDFGNGMTSTEKHPENIIFSEPGEYTVSLTTSNYCCSNTFTQTVEIAQAALQANTEIMQHVSCPGGNDAIIFVNVIGGNPPYTINFTPDISNQNGIPAGDYIATISDQDGQTVSDSFTIVEPDELEIIETITASEANLATGSIQLEVTGGTAPYSFLWSTNDISQSIENLAPGFYDVMITDANGCTWTESYEVPTMVGVKNEGIFSLGLSPNPTQHMLYIHNGPENIEKAFIIDSKGIKRQVNISTGGLDVSSLSNGIYMLHVISIEGREFNARFVKN